MIEQFGLTQHVTESTHRCDGWPDVILTRDDCSLVDLCIHPPTISDHGLVTATLLMIIEKIAAYQLTVYLETNKLLHCYYHPVSS